MNIIKRKNIILSEVEKKSSVTVHELMELLDVSGVTVRKLLNEMDKEGLIKRTRGGAVSLKMVIRESSQREKERKNTQEKQAIAAKAFSLITPGSTIYLDAGSTSIELARMLVRDPLPAITVVTNAINIAYELLVRESIEIIVIGGHIRHSIMSCVGSTAEDMINSLCFDVAFVGCNGFTLETGATTPNLTEAGVKKEILNNANRKYLISDSSKYGVVSMAKVRPLKQFDGVIVDWKLPPNDQEMLKAAGVELILAENPTV